MINKIDISDYTEESYQLNDNVEILFSEEGFFILSSEGIFTENHFKNLNKRENLYILCNEDKDQLVLEETDYQVIKKLYEEKIGSCKNCIYHVYDSECPKSEMGGALTFEEDEQLGKITICKNYRSK
jgi:hypothetical protein